MYWRALQGNEKAWSSGYTSTLDTIYNLGILYASRSKQGEAEKMYRRALHGYEKAVGLSAVARYMSALNTMWNLGSLFVDQGQLREAKKM